MKRSLLILTAIIGTTILSLAQVTSISVETFYTDNGSVAGYPADHTTYRIYANTTSSTDRVAVVSGDANSPLVLNVTGQGIWNHPNGFTVGDLSNCGIFSVIPALEYDSYVSVGYTCDDDGSFQGMYLLEDSNQPWQNQLFNTSPYGAGSVVVNSVVGATWFVLTDNVHSLGGASNKVLLAQITTDGDICGIFNLQVFPNYAGPGSPYVLQNGLQFGNIDCGTPGCTDAAALNFNAAADFDNGLCIFPCALTFNNVITQNPTCANLTNGSIQFAGTGNQSIVQHALNATNLGLAGVNGVTQNGLGNGSYTLSIHDTRFDNPNLNPGNIYGTCTITQSVTLNTPTLFMTSSTATNVTCSGAADGCVSTVAENFGGGTGDLSFKIYNNANVAVQDGSGNDLVLTTPNYCGLGGGTFHFVVTDANGCTATGSNFSITNPGVLALFEGAELAASCFNSPDATQVLTWGGGTGDVDFSLVVDGPYDIEGNPSNIVLSNLTPGTHMIYAQDINGCTTSLTFSVAGGPAITVNPSVTMPSCNGHDDGSIAIMAGGGTGTLMFSFDCTTFSATASMAGLPAGTYTVCVQDANNCLATQDVVVGQPDVLEATFTSSDISCFGLTDGSITVSPSGGTMPYAFSTDDINYTPSPVISGLITGAYDVHLSDGNGCHMMFASAITIVEPAVLASAAAGTNALCNGDCNGQLLMTTTGGTPGFTYSVNNGPGATINPITGLCPGSYTVSVSDSHGCTTTTAAVVIAEPGALTINGLVANPIDEDPGGNDPYTVTGGTAPYGYSWMNSNNVVVSTSENLPSLTGANDGSYTVTVTDDNGCVTSQSILVNEVGELGHEYSISLYPNPNDGVFVINIVGLKGEKMNYSVIDANGRIAIAKELGNVNGTRIESIDMQDAAAGIYHVQFMMGNEMHSMRFIKN